MEKTEHMDVHNHEHNHEHHHEHHHEHCACGHDHAHSHDSCGCGHDHEHGGNPKIMAARIITALVLMVGGFIIGDGIASTVMWIASYIIAGYDVLFNAAKNIVKGKVFDENFLMAIATVGALILREFSEAAGVMVFYQAGEYFQHMAVDKSRRSIRELMDIKPEFANVEINGKIERVNPETVKKGNIIVINKGERVPLDCVITKGDSFFDTSALTGESVPVRGSIDSHLLSGSINTETPVYAEVENEYKNSTVARILDMVENAQSKKSKSERFITVFARYYTPIVVALALLLAIVPSIITGDVSTWIYRALIFLVVSCPCALVISIPLGFFAGIGCASKNGILIKGGNYLEALSKIDTVIFDKTGTLTKGVFTVNEINGSDKEELLKLCAYAESYSTHPIAAAIKSAYKGNIDTSLIKNYREHSGKGISADIDGKTVLCGNLKLMEENGVKPSTPSASSGTVIYCAADGKFIGSLVISDTVKSDAKKAVSQLNAAGIKTVMLTGDRKDAALDIGGELGIQSIYYELLPGDKVEHTERIIKNAPVGKTVAFTGDGINDAPVLARADVGIAMGGLGSDSAVEAADAVIMNDAPSKIFPAIQISKKTMRLIKQNIIFAIGVKVIVMILSAIGYSSMWLAIFADVGVAFLCILNSLRAFIQKKNI